MKQNRKNSQMGQSKLYWAILVESPLLAGEGVPLDRGKAEDLSAAETLEQGTAGAY